MPERDSAERTAAEVYGRRIDEITARADARVARVMERLTEAHRLSDIHFDIAVEALGLDEVIRRRDERLLPIESS